MYLRVDTQHVPPTVEVCDQEDFTNFKVVVTTATHAWVDPRSLTELAGRASDTAWQDKLGRMISYAETKGWLDAQGHVRAHVELASDADNPSSLPGRIPPDGHGADMRRM